MLKTLENDDVGNTQKMGLYPGVGHFILFPPLAPIRVQMAPLCKTEHSPTQDTFFHLLGKCCNNYINPG